MNASTQQHKQIPPEIARYLDGPTTEGKQFDFLIGEWDVRGKRYRADGSILFEYAATWSAQYLSGGRIVMDEFSMLSPNSSPISSFVTLRTYSHTSKRWEMAGLQALASSPITDWHGNWQNGEMVLELSAPGLDGIPSKTRIRFFHIERDSFEWEIHPSTDGGLSWGNPLGALIAHRREKAR
jgi:hypothetical protein